MVLVGLRTLGDSECMCPKIMEVWGLRCRKGVCISVEKAGMS